MKNRLLALLLLFVSHLFSQDNETWRLGIQFGLHGNGSYASGGQMEAHSRFVQNKAGSAAFSFNGRFDYNTHWMVLFGFGLNSYGFDYAIAEKYSLLNKEKNYSKFNTSFSTVEVPILIHYKFNPTCKNNKWLLGVGFSQSFVAGQGIEKTHVNEQELANNRNFTSQTQVNNTFFTCLRMSIGYEKLIKNGAILNASMYANLGFKTIATSMVRYKLDNVDYQHEFSNNGNFVGLKLAYFLQPFTKG